MVSLPPVSSYQAQSCRTKLGDGNGAGVARPIGKKRQDESKISKTQESAKRKEKETLKLDFLGSSSESDGDFDPTMKALTATVTQKTKKRQKEKEEDKDLNVLSRPQNKANSYTSTTENRTRASRAVGGNHSKPMRTTPKRKTSLEDDGYDAETEKSADRTQSIRGVKRKSGDELNGRIRKKASLRAETNLYPRR